MPNSRAEDENSGNRSDQVPEGFAPGPNDTFMCLTCGVSVARRVGDRIQAWQRHDAWHDELERSFVKLLPGSMGGDNGGG